MLLLNQRGKTHKLLLFKISSSFEGPLIEPNISKTFSNSRIVHLKTAVYIRKLNMEAHKF